MATNDLMDELQKDREITKWISKERINVTIRSRVWTVFEEDEGLLRAGQM